MKTIFVTPPLLLPVRSCYCHPRPEVAMSRQACQGPEFFSAPVTATSASWAPGDGASIARDIV